MDRQEFFKCFSALAASIALPLDSIVSILPETYSISPISWEKSYDLYANGWVFRGRLFIGKLVNENTKTITLENPIQLCVDIFSSTELLDEESKKIGLETLLNNAKDELAQLNVSP